MNIIAFLRETIRSIGAFIIVGILATIVHFVVLKSLLASDLVSALWLANLMAFFCSLVVSYIGNHFFVFAKKRNHLEAFGVLLTGYTMAMLINTAVLVGLARGMIFTFFYGPAEAYGGGPLMALWRYLAETFPFLGDNQAMSTNAAFIVATGTSAFITYMWNRFVVFQTRVSLHQGVSLNEAQAETR